MTVKRSLCAALTLIVLISVLASCSGGDTASVSDPSGERTSGPAADFVTGASDDGSAEYDSGTVVVYSPHDADPLNAGITAFMAEYPDIKVVMVAGGTGEPCERVAAEAASPQADVLWGGGADSLEAYSAYFEPYVCVNDAAISEEFKDNKNIWIGESPLPMVIIYNKKLLADAGLSAPQSWNDLLDPAFKGQIAYCQPEKSGSAYTQLCTMILANGGKEDGWNYVKKLCANLDGRILGSSGKCHKMVASGECMVGITIEKSAALYKDDDNVGFSYPSEGTSAVPDAIAIVRNCPHRDNARTFVDFITSYESQSSQSSDWLRRPSRSDVAAPPGLPDISTIHLVNYDFVWAAADKDAIITRFNSIMGLTG